MNIIKRISIALIVLAVVGLPAPKKVQAATSGPPGTGWTTTFSDEFDGASVDASKWGGSTYNTGSPANGDEMEWYSSNNCVVSSGTLKMVAKKETIHSGKTYSSCMIASDQRFHQMYGYFEASMKIPSGAGFWPAFWLLPSPFTWPPEIDVMENLGKDPTVIYFTNHWTTNYPNLGGGHGGQAGGSYAGSTDFSKDFHTYGVLWDSTQVAWYLDGVQRARVTDHIPIPVSGYNGMFLVANLAVGGSWPGSPTASTVFPNQMEIDYIRVYAKGTDTTAPTISSVTSSATSSGTAISWTTNEASDSQVEYGTTTSYGSSTAVNSSLVTSHSQALSGLTASTTYHYRVKSKDAAGNLATSGDNTLTTAGTTVKTGDLNNDGKVDIFDYNLLVGNFGKTGSGIVGDIDNNGKVDIFDYNLLVGNFGK